MVHSSLNYSKFINLQGMASFPRNSRTIHRTLSLKNSLKSFFSSPWFGLCIKACIA